MNTHSTNMFSWSKAFLVFLIVGLLTLGASIFLQTHGATLSYVASDVAQLVAPSNVAGAGVSFQVPGKPVRLIIPSINVNANVQSVGLFWNGDGSMGIPTNFTDVAWYNGGPRPGEPGSAVIDGHLDGKDVKEAVFYNLDKLKAGDLVEVVDSKGQTLQFKVVATKSYDYNAPTNDIFSNDISKARLNLITCAGDWDAAHKIYSQRIVVFTELVSS
ncbi:MAG TPA: class F sortase [Candidatus Paceibacterota bacterium]|nr:class F sortase [Candidatus Paceibacterota bacterium]